MRLYHVTTEKKAKHYRNTGQINKPVRGFDTLMAAMAWCIKTNRKVIYGFDIETAHRLPDHHNTWGSAYWCDEDIPIENAKCEYSPKDA